MAMPYVVCHKVTTIDQKTDGYFLKKQDSTALYRIFAEQHRSYHPDAFLFDYQEAGKEFLNLSPEGRTIPTEDGLQAEYHIPVRADSISQEKTDNWAVIVDPLGVLPWESSIIHSDISIFEGARILVILLNDIPDANLAYLQKHGISYLFAGQVKLDLRVMLQKLREVVGIRTLMVEGTVNLAGDMLKAGLLDEVSFVVAPYVQGSGGRNAFGLYSFGQFASTHFKRLQPVNLDDRCMWMRYRRKQKDPAET